MNKYILKFREENKVQKIRSYHAWFTKKMKTQKEKIHGIWVFKKVKGKLQEVFLYGKKKDAWEKRSLKKQGQVWTKNVIM